MRRFLNRSTKMDFCTFRGHFGTLNATICWSTLHKLLTIVKYDVSAFTGKKSLMSADKNSSKTKEMKFWNFSIFFKKKTFFFKFWKSSEKNSSRSRFFWKVHSTSKLFRIASNHFQNFLKVSLERFDFTLNDFETLNATI